MGAIKSNGSEIESKVGKALWKSGLKYRKNSEKYFGKPDFILKKHKTVIFVDSCFWHGCKKHCRVPSSRKNYWVSKIARNRMRDKNVRSYYKRNNWKVFRIWEHNLKGGFDKTVCAIITSLRGQ